VLTSIPMNPVGNSSPTPNTGVLMKLLMVHVIGPVPNTALPPHPAGLAGRAVGSSGARSRQSRHGRLPQAGIHSSHDAGNASAGDRSTARRPGTAVAPLEVVSASPSRRSAPRRSRRSTPHRHPPLTRWRIWGVREDDPREVNLALLRELATLDSPPSTSSPRPRTRRCWTCAEPGTEPGTGR
jgi:hypothetical protein